ncbi:unnamed protein product [Meloidogyne enterolobii]|uniref:Uncharacterized protein n=2 Tax=Meloidogyne enterolobii TaxID=390850 RepID=A0A6V7VRZ5_MELEN|nr:unnamed protein product [Meloidogyne enterolobii]
MIATKSSILQHYSLNHSNFCLIFLFLIMFQYTTMALYIIQPEELLALKQQANDERDELELALRWRSLQQALKGRIDDLMDKERLLALLEERRNQITRNKRQQPIIFIEPEFEENEKNEIDENDQQDEDDGENDEPMMLILEEKQQPEPPQFLDDNQLFFMPD